MVSELKIIYMHAVPDRVLVLGSCTIEKISNVANLKPSACENNFEALHSNYQCYENSRTVLCKPPLEDTRS